MIFISAGHGRGKDRTRDPGAVFKDGETEIWEHIKAFELASLVYTTLYKLRKDVIFVHTGDLTSKCLFINSIASRDDVALEIHFNSLESKKEISMSEILIFDMRNKSRVDSLGDLLISAGIPMVRVRERKDLAFLRETKCFSIVLEVDFIWNMNKLDFGKISKAIIDFLLSLKKDR